MPIHDWTRVTSGDFHHFHQTWVPLIAAALNRGLLPPEFMAMADQVTGRPIPDVVTLQTRKPKVSPSGGVAVLDKPPTARYVQKMDRINYATRADRIAIRHRHGKVVAIIEILSPGNKESDHAIRSFLEKAADILSQGIHLLVVDLFPPTPRDPNGIHKAILDQFFGEPFDLVPEKPLTAVSYLGGDRPEAYMEPLAVGDALPSLPIFLTEDYYVPAPLETTYQEAWDVYPAMLKEVIESPTPPDTASDRGP